MAEIKQGNTIFTDTMDKIHDTKDGITCCGGNMRMMMHIDGTDFYESTYQCECGNSINIHAKKRRNVVKGQK